MVTKRGSLRDIQLSRIVTTITAFLLQKWEEVVELLLLLMLLLLFFAVVVVVGLVFRNSCSPLVI